MPCPNISTTPCDFAARRQIDFNEEVRKESEDVLEAERIAKEADKKPLWEQLAGKRDEKQAKFDAVRASMFGTLLCRRALWYPVVSSAFWWIRGSIYFAGGQAPGHGAAFSPQSHTTASFAQRAVLLHAAAPPRALDDEESNFLQGVEAQRLEAKERKKMWETEELRGFALARANQTGAWGVC